MWHVYDSTFTLQGIISEIIQSDIAHNFFETDELYMQIPYEEGITQVVQNGRFLVGGANNKTFRIHSLEINEGERLVDIFADGIETVLSSRILMNPVELTDKAETIMRDLMNQNIINPSDVGRKIPFIELGSFQGAGDIINGSWHGVSLEEVFEQLAKETGFGYRFRFIPKEKTITFETYVGTDRTTNQIENEPIRWSANWGDTRDEILIASDKSYRNVCYLQSGDDDYPILYRVGADVGWERFEMFSDANDLKRNMQEEGNPTLTTAQVQKLLDNRGRLELYRNSKSTLYQFILNEDVPQKYGVDFFEGDYISVINEAYGIVKHSQITSVKERTVQDQTRFEIIFNE